MITNDGEKDSASKFWAGNSSVFLCNTVAYPSDHKVSYPHDHDVSLHSPEILISYRQTTLKGKLGKLHITKSHCNALL